MNHALPDINPEVIKNKLLSTLAIVIALFSLPIPPSVAALSDTAPPVLTGFFLLSPT